MGSTATPLKPAQRRAAAKASRGRADDRPLLTIPEVARYLKIHRATVYGLINTGQLCSTEVAGKKRVRPADVDDYIDRHIAS
jgi:excisionase family DNA binding protein